MATCCFVQERNYHLLVSFPLSTHLSSKKLNVFSNRNLLLCPREEVAVHLLVSLPLSTLLPSINSSNTQTPPQNNISTSSPTSYNRVQNFECEINKVSSKDGRFSSYFCLILKKTRQFYGRFLHSTELEDPRRAGYAGPTAFSRILKSNQAEWKSILVNIKRHQNH